MQSTGTITVAPITSIWPNTENRRGWHGRELKTSDFLLPFNSDQVAAIQGLLSGIKKLGKPLTHIGKADFSHPCLDALLEEVATRVRQERGLVILTGLSGFCEEDLRIVHWAVGAHIGTALSQNCRGELQVDIKRKANSDRGSGTTDELVMHTDPAELIILMVIRPAKAGGISRFSSSLAAWDIMQTTHPDLVQFLRTGFRCWRYGEQAIGQDEYTPYNVPVFSEKDGLRSVSYARQTIDRAHADLDIDLSLDQLVALNMFDSLVSNENYYFEIMLGKGDIAFINNYEVLHSRTAYEDDSDNQKGRLILRLWIESFVPRPLESRALKFQNKSGRQGIDPR